MEAWQKGAPVVKKMSKAGQASYFKKFPDRESWFKQNHPDMAHFDTSAKQGSIQKVDKAKLAARAAMSLKAHGATKGVATGGEGGNAETPHKDTIAPLTRDQHSAVQSAKRSAEAPAPAKKEAPKAAPAAKPVDRLALIKAAAKKSQSAAGKMKRAAKFDVPTEDPDDATHDDYVHQHYGMHHYSEEVEQIQEPVEESTAFKQWAADNKKLKASKPPKSVTTVSLKTLEKNKRKNPNQSPFKTQQDKVNKYLGINEMDSEGYKGHRDDDVTKAIHKATPITRKAMAKAALKALQGTPVVSLKDLSDKEIGRRSKPLKANDPRVKFHKEESELEEGKIQNIATKKDDNGDYEATLHHAVKMAKGVAYDKRYKGGNMTGASNAIRSIGKKYGIGNLENHPDVKGALRMANEEVEHTDASKELVLHADNNTHLHRTSHQPIMANLKKKVEKGTYNHAKAKTLWKYHADRAAHSYAKEHGDGRTPWHKMFSVADRNRAANHFADAAKEHLGLNESYTGKGNHKPGWMLRADPELAAKFKEIAKRKQLKNKYAGKTSDEITALKKEEVSYIEERLTASNPPSEWIHDFVKSDNPKFAGKTKKERMSMALGAYYSAKRGK